jgi:fatty acid synthase
MGHSESTSGLCSVAKVIIGLENLKIPPNINFTEPRQDVPSLMNGTLKVVTEPTDLPESALVSINSFGFGGANGLITVQSCFNQK